MKKTGLILAIIFGVLFAATFFFAKDFDVRISEASAQELIDESMVSTPVSSLGVTLDIKSATIDFKENNTAVVNVEFKADGFGYSGEVKGDFGTGIDYREPKIYLANLAPASMTLNLDAESQGKVDDVKNVAKDFLKRQRDKMLSDEAKKSLDNIVGRNEDKVKELAVAATYKFFENMPIYDLNDAGMKGSIAALALKKVEFTETEAIVTLSPSRVIARVLSAFFAFLAIMMYLSGGTLLLFIFELFGREKDRDT
ncbi:MAG: hypothetical protein L3J65_07900 [Robiginitomaculum sp.]|nr:hypothetical protein [Robiginitomaculum sp.]